MWGAGQTSETAGRKTLHGRQLRLRRESCWQWPGAREDGDGGSGWGGGG